MEIRRGIPVSKGVAIGPALILDTEGVRISAQTIHPNDVDGEITRLHTALTAGAAASRQRQKLLVAKLGALSQIFDAHAHFYEDPTIIADFEYQIREKYYTAEYAVSVTLRSIVRVFERSDLGDRATRVRADFIDFEKNLLAILTGGRTEPLVNANEPVIVLANDLTPSETAHFDRTKVRALATESGGATSHTAILAGAMEIPAIVGIGRFLSDVSGGDTVIIDGTQGLLIIDPDPQTLAKYVEIQARILSTSGEHQLLGPMPETFSRDRHRIQLFGNIEFPSEAEHVLERSADGVGLYRTEFLYVNTTQDPTEEEHYQAYCEVLSKLGENRPVVIRTLDIGGDKFMHVKGLLTNEKNPFLGLRSVRLCLKNLPLFKTQLRAILRASVYGNARIMFPMVSTVMELRQCIHLLAEVREDLEEAGIPFNPNIPIGTMIEVPSAALVADILAKQVDFFSIGTNDLIQYTLAADRNNENVADLYDAADPAVLRLIDTVAKAARAAKIEVTVCGEMSGEPLYAQLLLGLGIRQLSATPRKLPELNRLISKISVADAELVAREALTLETAREVNTYLREQLRRILPDAID